MYRILQYGISENYGGTESVIMNWYRNIDRSLIQFDFIVNANAKKVANEEEILDLGGHIYRVIERKKEAPFSGVKNVGKVFFNDSNLVGVHMNINRMSYIDPIIAATQMNLPIRILHSHNGGSEQKEANSVFRSIYNNLNLSYAKRTADFWACSHSAGKYMFGEGISFEIINNAINLEQYKFNKDMRQSVRTVLGLSDELVVGFIGRLTEQKNPLFLLEIFNALHTTLNNTKLIVVGDGPLRGECENYVLQQGLINDVLFLGMKTSAEQYYSAIDFLLLPSLYEGFPMVVVESQAAGLPSLISNSITAEVGLTDLVNFESILSSPECWAEDICNILEKTNSRKDVFSLLIENGYDIVNQTRRLTEKYIQLIEKGNNQVD